MNRMRLLFISAALFSAVFVTSGCENAATQEALKSLKTEVETLQKTSSAQAKTLEESKKQLAEAQGKIAELTKENEELKAGKPHGKTEASGEKKSDAADKNSGKKAKSKARK